MVCLNKILIITIVAFYGLTFVNGDCEAHDCTTCLGNKLCGWCEITQKCIPTGNYTTECANCWVGDFQLCPS